MLIPWKDIENVVVRRNDCEIKNIFLAKLNVLPVAAILMPCYVFSSAQHHVTVVATVLL